MWFTNSHFQPRGKSALIIGASQGIGADFAQRLYEQGCSVILVARTESKLKQQVSRIGALTGDKEEIQRSPFVMYYACDVSDYDQCSEMWETLLESKGVDPDYIFCCAGQSIPKLFGDLSGKELALGVSVNYLTAVNSVHAGHKAIISKNNGVHPRSFKQRHVILFSSTVSSFPFIGYGQYAPSKAAIASLSIILRQELAPYNYRVSCVFPGNFQSEGFDEEQKTKPLITRKIEGPSAAIPSMVCCDMILDKLAKGYDSIYTDFIGWLLASSMLGVFPRCWGFFQVFVSFIFSLVAPIANMFIASDIKKSFDKNSGNDETQSEKKTK